MSAADYFLCPYNSTMIYLLRRYEIYLNIFIWGGIEHFWVENLRCWPPRHQHLNLENAVQIFLNPRRNIFDMMSL